MSPCQISTRLIGPWCPDSISREHAIGKLDACLKEIQTWMAANFLKLNQDKTEVLVFEQTPHTSDPLSLSIGGTSLQPSAHVRNLGVIFDHSMSMNHHVNSVVRSCFMQLRRIGRLRPCLTENAVKTLVHGLITSRLDYCNALLSGVPSFLIKKLQRVQNTAARLVARVKRSDHITPVLIDLHWLPVASRIQYKILMHTHRALNEQAPVYVSEMISRYNPSRSLRSSEQALLKVPRYRTRCGQKSFYVASPTLWNELPFQLRTISNTTSFKKQLKTHLFRKAFF